MIASKLKEKSIALDPGIPGDPSAAFAASAVDLPHAAGAAVQLLPVPIQNHFPRPVAADDVAMRLRAKDARVGHPKHGVGRRLRAVPAEEIEPHRAAQRRAAGETAAAPTRPTESGCRRASQPKSRTGRPSTRCFPQRFDQKALAVAAQPGVATRKVAQDRHVRRGPPLRLADGDRRRPGKPSIRPRRRSTA